MKKRGLDIRDDAEAMEHIAEEIDAQDGAFSPYFDISWTGPRHYVRLHALLDALVAGGYLRHLDLRHSPRYIRADVPCPVRVPVLSLYRLFSADGALLYVGCTSRAVSQRLKAHSKKPWWPDVARMTEECITGWQTAFDREAEAIRTEQPRWNVLGNPARLTRDERRAA